MDPKRQYVTIISCGNDDDAHRVTDLRTGQKFHVSTGSDVSVIPIDAQTVHQNKHKHKIFAIDKQTIDNYGKVERVLDLGLGRTLKWSFVLVNGPKAVIGADFIYHHNLVVDVSNKRLRLFDAYGNQPCAVDRLLAMYKDLVGEIDARQPAKHSTVLHINTNGKGPFRENVRPLSKAELKIAKSEFSAMCAQGICRPSTSPYASPLKLIAQPNGEWLVGGTYGLLNRATVQDPFPLLHKHDFTYPLAGTEYYTKIHIERAFYQVPVRSEDIEKTAIITPFGLFEFVVMPIGLRNCSATFQRLINDVLNGCSNFAFANLGEVCIASKTLDEHMIHVRLVLDRFRENGLRINADKSVFIAKSIEFFGNLIDRNGIRPLETKIRQIMQYRQPTRINQLRTFLGILNQYNRFIWHAADVLAPLYELTNGNDQNPIPWSPSSINAFIECKRRLNECPALAHPIRGAKLTLTVDSSDYAVGAILEQITSDGLELLSFFSRKLTKVEQEYSIYDRGLLAAYAGIKHFEHMLVDNNFPLYAYRKLFNNAFRSDFVATVHPQKRFLEYIKQYTTNIRHISTKKSHFKRATSINYDAIARAQSTDDELRNLMDTSTTLQFKQMLMPGASARVQCVTVRNRPPFRPFVPTQFRQAALENTHNVDHPTVSATIRRLLNTFFWPGATWDCWVWVRSCEVCQNPKKIIKGLF